MHNYIITCSYLTRADHSNNFMHYQNDNISMAPKFDLLYLPLSSIQAYFRLENDDLICAKNYWS